MDPEHSHNDTNETEDIFPQSVDSVELQQHLPSGDVAPPRFQFRQRRRLPLILFVATCLSTWLTAVSLEWKPTDKHDPDDSISHLLELVTDIFTGGLTSEEVGAGLTYSGCLMLILVAHEMGHYLQARRYGVPATLPFFIPLPLISPFGTLGAVIVQGAGVANRKQLFDIAISGPLAGLVLALPIAYFGIDQADLVTIPKTSQVESEDEDYEPRMVGFGDPLVLRWMIESRYPDMKPDQTVHINPLLFAGWVGIFVTALNLIPIGQLDGGHILFTLIRSKAHVVAMGLMIGAIVYMIVTDSYTYSVIVVLLLLMGPKHPPTADDTVSMGAVRVILGWLTLAFIIIGFTPTPIIFG